MLHFQTTIDMDEDENDENLDYDSDFADLEELLNELVKHKVLERHCICYVLLNISKTSYGIIGTACKS